MCLVTDSCIRTQLPMSSFLSHRFSWCQNTWSRAGIEQRLRNADTSADQFLSQVLSQQRRTGTDNEGGARMVWMKCHCTLKEQCEYQSHICVFGRFLPRVKIPGDDGKHEKVNLYIRSNTLNYQLSPVPGRFRGSLCLCRWTLASSAHAAGFSPSCRSRSSARWGGSPSEALSTQQRHTQQSAVPLAPFTAVSCTVCTCSRSRQYISWGSGVRPPTAKYEEIKKLTRDGELAVVPQFMLQSLRLEQNNMTRFNAPVWGTRTIISGL